MIYNGAELLNLMYILDDPDSAIRKKTDPDIDSEKTLNSPDPQPQLMCMN